MKIGTRVKALCDNPSWRKKGELGTIVKITKGIQYPIDVVWDSTKDGDFEPCNADELEVVNAIPLTVQFIPRTRKGVKFFQIKMSKNGKVFNHQYNSKQGAKKSFESLVNDLKNGNFIVK